MTEEVLFEVRDGVGYLTLNAPKRINALRLPMIEAMHSQLAAWADDDAVGEIDISGVGAHGFCAGADIKSLRESLIAAGAKAGYKFLETEYALIRRIAEYPKPVTSHLVGVSMGAGLGLGAHATRRIGEPATRFAMPETAIGLWPDVGVLYELARTPGRAGEYLAMSGETIDGASALWAGLLDECEGATPAESWLAGAVSWIDECFTGTAVEIMAALKAHPSPDAQAAAEVIASRSPFSVCLALQAVRNAREMGSVSEVLDQDLRLAAAMTSHPDDFVEGVRAKMVDKDNAPVWRHDSVAEVDLDEVAAWLG